MGSELIYYGYQSYRCTEDKDDETRDAFYGELQGVVEKVPRGDKLIVMGDFNTRVGIRTMCGVV